MNKTLMAGLSVLVLVIGVGTNTLYHAAEAKGMSKCWLNADGTVKTQYLPHMASTQYNTKYPIPVGKAFCDDQTKVLK